MYSLDTPYPDAPHFQKVVELGLWSPDGWRNFMLDPVVRLKTLGSVENLADLKRIFKGGQFLRMEGRRPRARKI